MRRGQVRDRLHEEALTVGEGSRLGRRSRDYWSGRAREYSDLHEREMSGERGGRRRRYSSRSQTAWFPSVSLTSTR